MSTYYTDIFIWVNCLKLSILGNFLCMQVNNRSNSANTKKMYGKGSQHKEALGLKTKNGIKHYDLQANRSSKNRLHQSYASLKRAGYAASQQETYTSFDGKVRTQDGKEVKRPHRSRNTKPAITPQPKDNRASLNMSFVSSETIASQTPPQTKIEPDNVTKSTGNKQKKSPGLLQRLFSFLTKSN